MVVGCDINTAVAILLQVLDLAETKNPIQAMMDVVVLYIWIDMAPTVASTASSLISGLPEMVLIKYNTSIDAVICLTNGVIVKSAKRLPLNGLIPMAAEVTYTSLIDKLLHAEKVTPYLTSGYRGIRGEMNGDTIIDVVNSIFESKRRILKT